jgi:hypothetical protein
MREDSAHAQNNDLSAAAEILTNSTYFPNMLRTSVKQCLLREFFSDHLISKNLSSRIPRLHVMILFLVGHVEQ